MKCHNGENWQVWPLLWNMPTDCKGGCEHGHSSSKFVPQLHTNEQNQHQFFATKTSAVVHDHTYSPDFTSCVFFFLSKPKLQLVGHYFLHVIPKSQNGASGSGTNLSPLCEMWRGATWMRKKDKHSNIFLLSSLCWDLWICTYISS